MASEGGGRSDKRAARPVRSTALSFPEARPAVVALLRAEVARALGESPGFEGTPASTGTPANVGRTPTGTRGAARALLPLGSPEADRALGGGVPRAGLIEIRLDQTREAGTGAGFALALAALFGAAPARPVLWIGEALAFAEAGLPYRPGLFAHGLDPDALLVLAARRLEDALWAGEEAARSPAPALAVLEVRGNPPALGLSGTRRLHLRALAAGRPVLLLRQGAAPEATAAPLRLHVAPAAAAPVPDLAHGPAVIGHPVFAVAVEKARGGRLARFELEWSPHDRCFKRPDAALSRPAVSPSVDRPDPARQPRPRLADGARRSA